MERATTLRLRQIDAVLPAGPAAGCRQAGRVQYLAATASTALAETFQNGRRLVTTRSDLVLLQWQPIRALTLLDLNGQFGIRNGGAATLAAGLKRFTQPRARAIHLSISGLNRRLDDAALSGFLLAVAEEIGYAIT